MGGETRGEAGRREGGKERAWREQVIKVGKIDDYGEGIRRLEEEEEEEEEEGVIAEEMKLKKCRFVRKRERGDSDARRKGNERDDGVISKGRREWVIRSYNKHTLSHPRRGGCVPVFVCLYVYVYVCM